MVFLFFGSLSPLLVAHGGYKISFSFEMMHSSLPFATSSVLSFVSPPLLASTNSFCKTSNKNLRREGRTKFLFYFYFLVASLLVSFLCKFHLLVSVIEVRRERSKGKRMQALVCPCTFHSHVFVCVL